MSAAKDIARPTPLRRSSALLGLRITFTGLLTLAVIVLVMLAALMTWYAFVPSWRLLLLPGFVILAVLASLGPALLITAVNVKYRDFRYIIPFIVQMGLYVSPVGFSSAARSGSA